MALQNKKSLGQNWLKDRDTLIDIADLASTEDVSEVLEIGPGQSFQHLRVAALQIVACKVFHAWFPLPSGRRSAPPR